MSSTASSRPRRAATTRSRPVVISSDDDSHEMASAASSSRPTAAKKVSSGRLKRERVASDTDASPEPAKKRVVRRAPAKIKAATKAAECSLEVIIPEPAIKRTVKRTAAPANRSLEDLTSPPVTKRTAKRAETKAAAVPKSANSSIEFLSDSENVSSAPKPNDSRGGVVAARRPPLFETHEVSDASPTPKKKPTKTAPKPSTTARSTGNLATAEEPNTAKRRSSRWIPPQRDWNAAQLLADRQSLDYSTAVQIVRLLDEDNTIPFLCRYRRELIGDLSPEQMRDIKQSYSHILNVKQKADAMLRTLEKAGDCPDVLRCSIVAARSLDELEHLYAPYKPASKLALSERARAIGLQTPAETLLFGEPPAQPLHAYVDDAIPGLESLLKIQEGMQHIGAHMISKDPRVLDELRALQRSHRIQLTSKLIPPKAERSKAAADAKKATTASATAKPVDATKFETYFEFRQAVSYVRPHQVLAINRGESLRVLSVKVEVPDSLRNELYRFARGLFLSDGQQSADRARFFDKAFDEAYFKKLQPLVSRQIRGELTKTAEAASIEVFATNLKQLLLMSPVKGARILGIDPGFANGCKLALISEQSAVLDTAVIYPHTRRSQAAQFGERLAQMMAAHQCHLIALGNGTACRETERWLGGLMADGVLDADRVRYCVVSEQGASIYSCGEVARQEFAELDVNLISAVSIARRLADPLAEFVKVDARHLGVGMYQHDVNEKLLTESLNEVVVECVSFVGVDLNTASAALLRHVAGLTAARAANICKHRDECGPFRTREQLRRVKQIGDKTFQQCAGFVRIEPLTAGGNGGGGRDACNPLDATWVHPESYQLAESICRAAGIAVRDIGTAAAIAAIGALLTRRSTAQLAAEFAMAEERVAGVCGALQRELLRDYRVDVDKRPMFKQGVTSMADLREGTAVSGAITNQTHFGCFVDIGVERDGLIHCSQLGGQRPNIGDRVEAVVKEVDAKRGRIQLRLVAIV